MQDAIHLGRKDHVCQVGRHLLNVSGTMTKFLLLQICGKAFSRDKTLRQHLMYHLNERNIVCEVCGFKTVNRPKMTRHMKSVRNSHSTRIFNGNYRFQHTGERNYECTICGKRFLYSYNVTAHIKHVHFHEKRPTTNEEKLICTVCGKVGAMCLQRDSCLLNDFHVFRNSRRFGRSKSIWRMCTK